MKESQRSIQPILAPPLPPKALALATSRQVAPNFLLYPVSDVREAPAGVAHGKVIHPAAQNGIDLFDQLLHRLRPIASEDQLELAQQCRSLLGSRRVQRHPSSPPTADATELKTEKPETLPLLEIHPPALLLVHLNLEFGQFLAKSLLHCPPKPGLPRMTVDQDHQIVGEPGVLDFHPRPLASDFLRPLQHLVHLIKVEITEQGRNHPALRNTLLPRRLQQQLEQPQHLSIADPSSHFFQQEVMPYRVKVGSEIKIDDMGEPPQDRFRDALDRSVG